ncbi:MAG: hypothetical protein E7321_02955 [Clostridiales bacterium]|nr:hypothetical protein [Clostridiales bacterium]
MVDMESAPYFDMTDDEKMDGIARRVCGFVLLDSALESAFATFGGEELDPEKEEKRVWLGFLLIGN